MNKNEKLSDEMICFRCGKPITFWQLLFNLNYEHCIIGDAHKRCIGGEE